MENQEELLKTIYICIDELNQQLPAEGKLVKAPATILVGEGGILDSLGLISFLVNTEQAITERHALIAPLLDELMAEHVGQHPFHSLSSLAAWVAARATEKKAV